MNVIDPINITTQMITLAADKTYTNAYVDAYSAGTDYIIGDKVKIADTPTIYWICTKANGPGTVVGVIDPLSTEDVYWSKISASYFDNTSTPLASIAAYSAPATKSRGDLVKIVGTFGANDIYECIEEYTSGSYNPATDTNKWRFLGTVYDTWVVTDTYVTGDIVTGALVDPSDGTEHYIYEALTGMTNPVPAVTDTTKWLQIGPTNNWASFDLTRDTQTTIAKNIVKNNVGATVRASSVNTSLGIVITPGERINSLALLGIDAKYVNIKIHSPNSNIAYGTVLKGAAGTIASASDPKLCYDSGMINLVKRESTSHYQYFFKGFETVPSFAIFDIPPNTDNIISITLTSTVGEVSLGACCLGMYENIGTIQYEAENDVLNFSTFTRDFAGSVSSLVQRRNVPKTIQQIWTDKKNVNNIRVLRDALAGTPAVWCGLDDDNQSDYYEALLILGIYKKFSINIKSPEKAVISLELEEY